MCQCSGQRAAYASLVSFSQGRHIPLQTHRMTQVAIYHQVISHPTIPSTLQSCGSILNSLRLIPGVYIIVGGGTGESLCPVAAVLHYLTIRGMEAGPLFRFSDGWVLTRQRFVSSIRQTLSDLGLDTSLYSGHRFRIGAATTAAAQGISDALIKTMEDGKVWSIQSISSSPNCRCISTSSLTVPLLRVAYYTVLFMYVLYFTILFLGIFSPTLFTCLSYTHILYCACFLSVLPQPCL